MIRRIAGVRTDPAIQLRLDSHPATYEISGRRYRALPVAANLGRARSRAAFAPRLVFRAYVVFAVPR
jgi:hypothetical protein